MLRRGRLVLFGKNMTSEHLHFNFGAFNTSAHIASKLPSIGEIAGDFGGNYFKPLLVCDGNTEYLAAKIRGDNSNAEVPICTLEPGESHKNWQTVEAILRSAHDAGLGRDGTFIGVGGGVVGDLCAFAASIYMRGCSLALVSTTLLGMVDASLGGKTGFDLFNKKNLAGTYYPARHVYMPMESLTTLPPPEWRSGMAELIKTAILDGNNFLDELTNPSNTQDTARLANFISRAARYKGGIVAEDPQEMGNKRVLLNLGHTFGHALESTAGLGTISHGEAVAWGIARSCDLGLALGITPHARAEKIKSILTAYNYERGAPHPLMKNADAFIQALGSDKKKRGGNLTFIVPDEHSARPVAVDSTSHMDTVRRIITGELLA